MQLESSRTEEHESVSFEAYGRRFDLRLSPNERVQRAVRAFSGGSVALQGAVEGAPRSWARMTRSPGGRWHGMFFDGVDVYAIEPAENLQAALVQPSETEGGTPVIFRLSDALLPLGSAQCSVVEASEKSSALKAYEAVAHGSSTLDANGSPTKRLVVGVVADFEFASFFDGNGTTAEQAIVERMNIVDGIFSAQLGVTIELGEPVIFRHADDPFRRTNANELLDELRRYRATSAVEMSRGVTHLMTGRDMDGDTVGVAYLGSVCGGGAASSLSEGTRSTTSAALIAAHEIAHNFNAPHDGDTKGACATTPQTFLMAPRLNGSQEFSSCSIEQMTVLATSGRCLVDVDPTPIADPGPSGGSGGTEESGGGGGPVGLSVFALLALALARRLRASGFGSEEPPTLHAF